MKKKVLMSVLAVFSLNVGVLTAQPGGPGGPPEPEDPPVGIPIDGGALGLLALGISLISASYIKAKKSKKS